MSDAHRDEVSKLESLYEQNPEGRIFTHLAEAYRKGGALDRAHEVLDEGIVRHPDYSSAHVVLGRVLMDQGRDEEAERAFRRVLELDPHNLIAIRSLGDLARARGDREQALEHYQRLLDQEPGEGEVRDIVEEMTTGGTPGPEAEAPEDDTGGEGWVGGEPEPPYAPAQEEPIEAEARWDAPLEDEPIGDEARWDEARWDEPRPEEARQEEPTGFGALGDESDDAEVRTETIAQVYARQGLYDRAAEVYRELVRSRPEDDGLRDRLAEMEQLAAAQSAADGEIDAVSDYERPRAEGGPPEGFESGELDVEGVDATPLAGMEVDESDPTTGLRADATPETATPEEDLSAELDVTDVPEPPEESPWGGAMAVEMDEEERAPDESVWSGAEWREDTEAESTPHAWTEIEDEADDSPPIRDYFSGLLGWSAAGASESAPEAPPAEPAGSATDAAAAGSETGAGEGAAGRAKAGEDDDDLEMFRSWLESLKQ